ncbi:MAG: hypothetical protein JSS78_03060 [Bacteroidetes bacterium]|nr:hypothetical protein [Bacteroidota bacterium]
MPQVKPGIATTILAPEAAGEGFVEISPNKTLFIQKLTNDEAIRPEIVEGLQTVEAVFAHFNPNVDVELESEDGSTHSENFAFGGLGDFDTKNIKQNNPFLSDLDLESTSMAKMIKKLKSNKSLQKVIENPETKEAFLNALKVMADELAKAE